MPAAPSPRPAWRMYRSARMYAFAPESRMSACQLGTWTEPVSLSGEREGRGRVLAFSIVALFPPRRGRAGGRGPCLALAKPPGGLFRRALWAAGSVWVVVGVAVGWARAAQGRTRCPRHREVLQYSGHVWSWWPGCVQAQHPVAGPQTAKIILINLAEWYSDPRDQAEKNRYYT